MRNRFLLTLTFLVLLGGAAFASDVYWVSLGTDGDAIRLMKINALGQVVKAPTVVVPASDIDGGEAITAIAPGASGKLNLWYEHFGNAPFHKILHGSLDKSTLNGSFKVFGSFTAFGEEVIQASQGSRGFLIFESSDGILKAFGSDSAGAWDGTSWRISPRTNFRSHRGGVSADGRMAWVDDVPAGGCVTCSNKLYVQPLKSNGLAKGSPAVAASADGVAAADVSNILAGNRRLFVYYDVTASEVFSQTIDASTGNRMGSAHLLGPSDSGNFSNNVAVDPKGQFVIFATTGSPCGDDIILFQALDATGAPSGSRKTLVGCGVNNGPIIGIDLMLDQQ